MILLNNGWELTYFTYYEKLKEQHPILVCPENTFPKCWDYLNPRKFNGVHYLGIPNAIKMKKTFAILVLVMAIHSLNAQTDSYTISFENANHHEAEITATFPQITSDTLSLRMARSSPGRYALHEFAKNVYNVKAFDGEGKPLKITRPNPYQWNVTGHNGTVKVQYTLFGNRGDGTYAQIDETHAHLNVPAVFMYVPKLDKRRIEVTFNVRTDLNWKVATQLPLVSGSTYYAPDFQYFMDSPIEISDYDIREFQVTSNNKKYNIQFVLHHNGTEAELDTYFEKVKKIVLEQMKVYGELPDFDFGKYTFLACYLPNASGDGMEHRNSTTVTSTRALSDGGMEGNIGTVSHEFFHSWNVERIRPKSLEPFQFDRANMSGALWFAEGFTSYYTNLFLCRTGLISPTQYVEGLAGTFNYVWNSPARQFFGPVGMSEQAPFVDAATSVDPVNRENMFISYYSYGSMMGLALDLSLRQNGLNLDGFMKLAWQTYGKTEIPYTLENLQNLLGQYAGKDFGDNFFNNYIYDSKMPGYAGLMKSVGVELKQNMEEPYFGANTRNDPSGAVLIVNNTKIGSPAYVAGLDNGDNIVKVNGAALPKEIPFPDFLKQFKVGDTLHIDYERYGESKSTAVVLGPNPTYSISLFEKGNIPVSEKLLKARREWLNQVK